jgi:signal transduction histidine kinase
VITRWTILLLYAIDAATFQKSKENYTDTLIYEPVDDELDEYRKLNTFVEIHNQYYKLEILAPHLEADEMLGTIAFFLGILLTGLSLSFYLSQRIISRKIWKPFYDMLEKLRGFRLDKQQLPELSSSQIEEFKMLNESINELVLKNMEVFTSQKQFIENASHEMQNTTCRNAVTRLEALIGGRVDKRAAEIVEGLISSTQRLKKLNKTLLLLSKIENRQFLLTDQVDVNQIIRQSMEYYEEQKSKLNISVTIKSKPN